MEHRLLFLFFDWLWTKNMKYWYDHVAISPRTCIIHTCASSPAPFSKLRITVNPASNLCNSRQNLLHSTHYTMDTIYNSSMLAVSSETSKFSSNLTSIVSFLATIVGVFYFSMLLWVVNLFRMQPRVFKRDYSQHLQLYAPCELCLLWARIVFTTSGVVYIFIVINSLVEVQMFLSFIFDLLIHTQTACASWLLVQHIHQQAYPDSPSRSALQLIMSVKYSTIRPLAYAQSELCLRFCSCWTLFTAGFLTIMFIHPTWSTHPVASVGSQTIWVIVTLGVWVAGATILACELPAQCISVAYCSQIRALFGLFSASFRIKQYQLLTIALFNEAFSLLETWVDSKFSALTRYLIQATESC